MERGQSYGINVLHPKESSTNSAVNEGDIIFEAISLVAVHGLAGDPFTTWTHVKGQPMWLRDLLPQAMPNVRTMTYGYNASFLNYTANQDVRSIAAKLLAELADLRSGERVSTYKIILCGCLHAAHPALAHGIQQSRRPIVFVCHSLGGIIAKKVGPFYHAEH
ncbi:MAG: hypothetical protein Q9164_003918 [Protoblastenia rupestris]